MRARNGLLTWARMTLSAPSASASPAHSKAHPPGGLAAHALTADGWRIAIHPYAPSGPVRRKHAVVLCHGLASNHLGFDVHPDVSLARHLARRGYLTLALDLRGGGDSERPSLGGARHFGWSFDDYLFFDVPAALAYAKHVTGAAAVHWVGHSMGGILGYAHLARGGSADMRSLTVIGSSLDYSGSSSGFHSMVPFPRGPRSRSGRDAHRGLLRADRGPARGAHRNAVRAFQRVAVEHRSADVAPPGSDHGLPCGLAAGDGAARDGDAAGRAAVPRRLNPLHRRARLGHGAGAGSSRATAIRNARRRRRRRTLEALGSARRELAVFGPEHGHADHYAHFDLLGWDDGRRTRCSGASIAGSTSMTTATVEAPNPSEPFVLVALAVRVLVRHVVGLVTAGGRPGEGDGVPSRRRG